MDCEVRMKSALIAAILLIEAIFASGPDRANSSSSSPATDEVAILVGAGDIADCKDLSGAEATAKLLDQIPAPSWFPATSPTPAAAGKILRATTNPGAEQ